MGTSSTSIGLAFFQGSCPILRHRMAIGSEKARSRKTYVDFRFLKDLGFLEASLESDLASWSRLGAFLE
eukprot:9474251-Pyramimonas_sp.AAC.1